MKSCPICGKAVPKNKSFCENCGSSVVFPGIREDVQKKNIKKDNVEEIEILDESTKKQDKNCRICGKELAKKGICKECESSTFMPGVDKNDIYKFCGHCGQELNEDGICNNCNLKNDINDNEISPKTGVANLLSFFSILSFFAPLVLRLNSVNVALLLAYILIIFAKVIDSKNKTATVMLIIEIIFTIIFILPLYVFFESCKGMHL